jgi:pilus assembly protein Flp/PilA
LPRGRSSQIWQEVAMRTLVARFLADRSGATAIEYALIGSLVSIAIIIGATAIGIKLNDVFNSIAGKFN